MSDVRWPVLVTRTLPEPAMARIIATLEGARPPTLVNPEAWDRRRATPAPTTPETKG